MLVHTEGEEEALLCGRHWEIGCLAGNNSISMETAAHCPVWLSRERGLQVPSADEPER
jgi:hypothetical protein